MGKQIEYFTCMMDEDHLHSAARDILLDHRSTSVSDEYVRNYFQDLINTQREQFWGVMKAVLYIEPLILVEVDNAALDVLEIEMQSCVDANKCLVIETIDNLKALLESTGFCYVSKRRRCHYTDYLITENKTYTLCRPTTLRSTASAVFVPFNLKNYL